MNVGERLHQRVAHSIISKPCLLLIPGTLCDSRMFAQQVRALRGHALVHHADYSLAGTEHCG